MPPLVATVVYSCGILALFLLNLDRKSRTSAALWLPVAWLLINGSRPLTLWFQARGAIALDDSMEQGNPLGRNVFLVILILGVLVLWNRRAKLTRFLHANLAIVPFVAYCAVSIAWSDFPFVAFKRWVKLLGDFTMVLIVLTDLDRSTAVKRIFSRVAFVLFPVSVLLIKYYPQVSRYYSAYEGNQYYSGVAVDKNMLGMTCLVFGLGVLWQFLSTLKEKRNPARTRRLVAQAAVLVIVLWLFHMANSMTSLSCFVLAGSLLTATSLFRVARKPMVVHLMVAMIVAVSFSVLFLHVDAGALKALGRNPTLTGRTEIWSGLLAFRGNALIGTGFDSFWLGDRLDRIWAAGGLLLGINEAHNGYLETFLNLGWVGVALLAGLIITGYRNVMISFRREPEMGRLRLALFTMAIVYSFTEVGFRTTCSVWIAFVLAIMAVPIASSSKRSRPRSRRVHELASPEPEVESWAESGQGPGESVPVETGWPRKYDAASRGKTTNTEDRPPENWRPAWL
jgi:exopolysaccharide production protein ExoQ